MERNDKQIERDAPIYNLKVVVKETGIKPPTLRAWERRYGFPRPTRTEGRHRKYTQHDVDTLRWLVARQNEGMSISHAIDLYRSLSEAGEDPTATDKFKSITDSEPVSPIALGDYQQIGELREAWIQSCLAFDRRAAERVLARAFALFRPEVVSVQLLQHGLAKIGDGWHRGEVTVQQEHFASALSAQRLEMLIASTAPPWRPETLIIGTAEGDFHTFGALLFTFLLRRQGWNIIYLGASVPAGQFEATIERIQPHLVVITAQLLRSAAALKEVAELLQTRGTKLAFGGGAFDRIDEPQRFIPGDFLGHSLEEALQVLPSLLDESAVRPLVDKPIRSLAAAAEGYTERRAFIESNVRAAFVTSGKPTDQLASINIDFSEAVVAALRLGDIKLLATDLNGIQDLLIAHRWPSSLLNEYLVAYHQAARIHLSDSANIIVDWLESLISD